MDLRGEEKMVIPLVGHQYRVTLIDLSPLPVFVFEVSMVN